MGKTIALTDFKNKILFPKKKNTSIFLAWFIFHSSDRDKKAEFNRVKYLEMLQILNTQVLT